MSKYIELTKKLADEMEALILKNWGEDEPRFDLYYNVANGEIAEVYSGEEQYYKFNDGWRCVIDDANSPETWGGDDDSEPEEGIISGLMMDCFKSEIEDSMNVEEE